MDTNINNTVQKPKISVLMPVYNAGKYLREAIESILAQTFSNFEFIIVNDGSTDRSKEIIHSFFDSRIRYVENEHNLGLVESLNKGILLSRGTYIARMDADDISTCNRLEVQYAFMEANLDIGVVGSWARVIGTQTFVIQKQTEHDNIQASMLWESAFVHPTVMMRKSVLDTHHLFYDKNFSHAEDRELWFRMVTVTKFANLEKVFLLYRRHGENISLTQHDTQTVHGNTVIRNIFHNIGMTVTDDELHFHRSQHKPEDMTVDAYLQTYSSWLMTIYKQNKKMPYFNDSALYEILALRFVSVCYANTTYGFKVYAYFTRSPFFKTILSKHPVKNLKLLCRCLF